MLHFLIDKIKFIDVNRDLILLIGECLVQIRLKLGNILTIFIPACWSSSRILHSLPCTRLDACQTVS